MLLHLHVKMIAHLFFLLIFHIVTISELCLAANTSQPPVSLATPFPCQGFCSDLQDTTVIRSPNGTIYRFSAFSNITVATATSFNDSWVSYPHGALWNSASTILNTLPAVQNFWAPQVIQLDGVYYLYYVVQNFNAGSKVNCSHAIIGVATSPSLELGSWIDHGSIGIPVPTGMISDHCSGRTYSQIGPSILVDDGNHAAEIYLSFGSYLSDMVGMPMANPPLTVQPGIQPTSLVADDYTPGTAPSNRSEGSFLWKRQETGTYYLFYSDGNCCVEAAASADAAYKIKYCTATEPLGPYRTLDGTSCLSGQGGDLLMGSHGDVRAPGSLSVVQDEVEGLIMVYQWMNVSTGVQGIKGITFGWNYLGFDEDGVPMLSETKFENGSRATSTSMASATATMAGAAPTTSAVNGVVSGRGRLSQDGDLAGAILLLVIPGFLFL